MDMMVSNIVAVPVINIPSTPLTPPVLTQASVASPPPTPAPVANAPADTASAEPGSTDSNDKREAEESVIVADATGPAAAPIAAAPLPVCN
ncbi:MAG: hypothetical protein A3J49_18615 [Gallionellales bacterium RIFCSPHIGHO2_02_FULL_57_16]|nr:MAG: hypothetical protein A3J49_18615 [Gallionellales bacterium RIFCSPHIGHO2_02_FULL_57_16]